MWERQYADYKKEEPVIKTQVEPSHGIIGAEMHDLNGWGVEYHIPRKKVKGTVATLFSLFFGTKVEE